MQFFLSYTLPYFLINIHSLFLTTMLYPSLLERARLCIKATRGVRQAEPTTAITITITIESRTRSGMGKGQRGVADRGVEAEARAEERRDASEAHARVA